MTDWHVTWGLTPMHKDSPQDSSQYTHSGHKGCTLFRTLFQWLKMRSQGQIHKVIARLLPKKTQIRQKKNKLYTLINYIFNWSFGAKWRKAPLEIAPFSSDFTTLRWLPTQFDRHKGVFLVQSEQTLSALQSLWGVNDGEIHGKTMTAVTVRRRHRNARCAQEHAYRSRVSLFEMGKIEILLRSKLTGSFFAHIPPHTYSHPIIRARLPWTTWLRRPILGVFAPAYH